MVDLNLPPFDYKLKKADGKLWIFDVIRKKYIVLLPEEWVRQHFIHYLIDSGRYPKSLIKIEGGLRYNELRKRSDILVYDRAGKPWMIVECKAPEIKVTEETVFQASVYNATIQAKYVAVTNGLTHLYASVNWETKTTKRVGDLPLYPS